MFDWIRNPFRQRTAPQPKFFPLSALPEGFFADGHRHRSPSALTSHEQAYELSPFFAALRLYQSTFSQLPFVTYKKTSTGRQRARQHPAYKILSERPNPSISAADFWEFLVKEYWIKGEAFAFAQWAGNHKLLNLFPIPSSAVNKIEFLPNYEKRYFVQTAEGERTYEHDEIIHIIGPVSHDGYRGVSFLDHASSALGLHHQVQTAASAYYRNAANPKCYISFPGTLTPAALKNNKESFHQEQGGAENTGRTAVLQNGGMIHPFPCNTADDAKIIEAIGASTPDIARWFGVSPLLLADLEKSTYSNLGADHQAFYVKSLSSVLHKFTLQFNYTLFGSDADYYGEFLTQKILQADPTAQTNIWDISVRGGWLLRSEVREFLNMHSIDGLDNPTLPSNVQALDEDGKPITSAAPAPAAPPEQESSQDEEGPDEPDSTDEDQNEG